MMDIVSIEKDGKIYAYFFKASPVKGVQFLTPPEAPFQLGVMEHPAGHKVKPHRHASQEYPIDTTGEFIFIERGKVKATVFDDEWNILGEQVLDTGDFLLFLYGGHTVEFLEDTRAVEVKQGPYLGVADAKIFPPRT